MADRTAVKPPEYHAWEGDAILGRAVAVNVPASALSPIQARRAGHRRLMEPTKAAVREMKQHLDRGGVIDQDGALRTARQELVGSIFVNWLSSRRKPIACSAVSGLIHGVEK